jgi:hypothetical protein
MWSDFRDCKLKTTKWKRFYWFYCLQGIYMDLSVMHIKIHVPGDDSYRRKHETRHRYRSDFEARYVNFMYFHNQRKWRRVVFNLQSRKSLHIFKGDYSSSIFGYENTVFRVWLKVMKRTDNFRMVVKRRKI